jgi:hypothetical protein
MEIIKCKKINLIVLVLSVGFLFLASCTFGQAKMELLRDNTLFDSKGKEIVTLFPSYTMFFQSGKIDTIFVGIKADSINKRVVSPNLYTFLPKIKLVNHKFLSVGFEDGTIENFQVVYIDKSEGYVEYNFSQTAYASLSNKKVTYIGLDGISKFNNKEYVTYFMDFLKLL